MKKQDLISIIVPIYNVEDYLGNCIESIVAQTYENLEILLINDGSTDNCEKICLEWCRKDDRILYISKKNETLGPTRNLGIQMARGQYIAFVDADDWIDRSFIQKLYSCVTEEDRDFARCDYYIVRGSDKWIQNNNEYYPFNECNIRKMIASTQAITIWTGLYKKTLWTDHRIEMPPGPHQDLAILGLVFIYAKKIGRCREGLYYYRESRKGNITMSTMGYPTMLPALKHLIGEYTSRKLFDTYREELWSICINKLNTGVAWFDEEKNLMTKKQYVDDVRTFLGDTFQTENEYYDNKMIAIGSYNLQRVLSRVYFNDSIEDLKFQHSSIISMMAARVESVVSERKSFRDRMICADFEKKLADDIQNLKIKYLLIDFLEERNDIWDLGEDRYITDSEAFKEKGVFLKNACLIKRETEECRKLWENKCLQFIELLKKYFVPENIFLVKFMFAEGYGVYGGEKQYEDIGKISKLNRILESYYAFFEQNYSGINVIQPQLQYIYTETCTKYGCTPWHLNINVQFDVQDKINALLRKE